MSTTTEVRSGLGIEGQRAAIGRFAQAEGCVVRWEYLEIETGKGSDALDRRPKLVEAIAEARQEKCSIVVAKLDRLSRNVHFVSGLMASRVRFMEADLGPGVDPFLLHIYAAMVEQEARVISQRTKAALEAAKVRGAGLGCPKIGEARVAAERVIKANADAHAQNVRPIIDAIRKSGANTVREIAAALNARGIATARGGRRHPSTVQGILARS